MYRECTAISLEKRELDKAGGLYALSAVPDLEQEHLISFTVTTLLGGGEGKLFIQAIREWL